MANAQPTPIRPDNSAEGSSVGRDIPVDVALIPIIVALAVLVFINPAAEGVSAAIALGVLAIGALTSLAFSRDPFAADNYSRFGIAAFAALAGWLAITRIWGADPGGSMLEAGRFATFALVVWAGRTALTRASSRWALLAVLALGAFIASLPELWFVLQEGAFVERRVGELGYWNATAIVSLVGVPIATALVRTKRRWGVPFAALLIVSAATTAAATASRGALAALLLAQVVLWVASSDRRRWIAPIVASLVLLIATIVWFAQADLAGWIMLLIPFLVSLAVFWFVAGRSGSIRAEIATPRPRRLSVFGALLMAAMALLIGVLAFTFAQRASSDGVSNDNVSRLASTTDSLRFEWWKETLDLWQEGRAFGQGGRVFEASRAWRENDFAAHPHSLVLEVLVEAGIIGLVLLAAASLLILRAMLAAPRSPERAVAAAIAILIFAQAAIDWTFSLPHVMALLACAIAILLPGRSRSDYPILSPLAPASLRASLATASVLAIGAILALAPAAAGLLADQAAADIDDQKLSRGKQRADLSMRIMPTYETLLLQVISAEFQNNHDAARDALRQAELVWWNNPRGLEFARQRFNNDTEMVRRIDQQLAAIEQQRAEIQIASS